MSLIDNTYFTAEINLPSEKYGQLTAFISRCEKEILVKLFGYTLYKLIAAYDKATSPQRIKDIVEGKEFELDGKTYNWNGLINSDKISILAFYVYYHYQRYKLSTTSTTGEVKDKHENSESIELSNKIAMAWHRMVVLIGDYHHSSYNLSEYFNSLHYFMEANYAAYPEWEYTEIGEVNSFDL